MTNEAMNLRDGIRTILTPALSFPAQLDVRVAQDKGYFAVTVACHPTDMPRLIGNGGNNVRAVKGILAHIGQRNKCFIRFQAVDAQDPTMERHAVAQSPDTFNAKPVLAAGRAALRLARYRDTLLGPESMEGKEFITCPAVLDDSFSDCLARWLHVCGRAQGGNIVFRNERASV